MLFELGLTLQDVSQIPTSGGGDFNWADYGPLGIMAFGLLSAVVVLWRKNERLEAESKAQAEKVLTVLIEVQRVLPDVLSAIRETRSVPSDVSPALERLDDRMKALEKAVRAFARSVNAKSRTP